MRPLILPFTCLVLIVLAATVPAHASVHFMVIDEIYPGHPGASDAQYVMLRMTGSGQRFTSSTYIRLEDADGNLLGRFGTIKASMSDGGSLGCAYPACPVVLIGTKAAEDLFFSTIVGTFDQLVDGQTDGGAPPVPLPRQGGRACFVNSIGTTVYDCVAWGTFDCTRSGNCAGQNTARVGDFSGNAGDLNFDTPAQALQTGFALSRTQFLGHGIKNNSLDFELAFPHPVANSGANANIDGDGDGLINILDCDDQDETSLYAPGGTEGLQVTIGVGAETVLSWFPHDSLTGSSTVYDVVSGKLLDLLTLRDYSNADCLAQGVSEASFTDSSPDPLGGDGKHYLVRTRNNCSAGTYGDSDLDPDPRDLLDDRFNGPCM